MNSNDRISVLAPNDNNAIGVEIELVSIRVECSFNGQSSVVDPLETSML